MKRRLCIVGPAASVHVQRWAGALLDRGWQVSVLSTSPMPAGVLQGVPALVLPHAVRGMPAHRRLVTLLRGWGRVPGLVAALRPDVVHLHSFPTPAAVPLLRSVRPLVVSAWGSDVVGHDPRKAQLYPWLIDYATAITATSDYLADVVKSYQRRPRPIMIVPFGVDAARFRPPDTPPSEARIGSLRNLEWKYGLDVLVDALALIGRTYPRQRLEIGGAGEQRGMLEERARLRGVADRTVFHGAIPHAAAPEFMRSLAIFANPSRVESFGVAALEAQATGLPVVASRVGGLPEIVEHGVTGLLVPPEDPAALAGAIVELLGDAERRAAMGRAGRLMALDSYSWQESVDRMEHVYEQVLCGGS